MSFLQKAHTLLELNGVFALCTVNTDSLTRRLFRERWRYFIPPEHLVYFNLENLRWALAETGFEILEYRTNFSYRSVLNGLRKGIYPSEKILPAVKLLFFVPKIVSQRLGWGDIVEIWARKLD